MNNVGFKTKCVGCYFAKMSDDIQIGCQLNKLKHFENQNKTIERVDKHFVVWDTVCNSARGHDWANQTGCTPSTKVKEETKTTLTWIIVDDVNNRSYAEIYYSLIDRLVDIEDKNDVIFISKNKRVLQNISKLHSNMTERFDNDIKIIFFPNIKGNFIDMINEAVFKVKTGFYTAYNLNQDIPCDVYLDFNNARSICQLPIMFLDSERITDEITGEIEFYGPVCNTKLHKMVGQYPKEFIKQEDPEYNYTWTKVKDYLKSEY